MERVLGIQVGGAKKAYPFSRLKGQPLAFEDDIAGQKIVIHFDRKSRTRTRRRLLALMFLR